MGAPGVEERGLRSANRHLQDSHGDVKSSTGTMLGVRGGMAGGSGGCWVEEGKGGNQDKCNNITHKIK